MSNSPSKTSSIADRDLELPTFAQLWRVLSMRDYNTRIVVLGTSMLGMAAGLVGSFTLLRKRALMGDALSHATLPGIAIAFVVASAMGADGKNLVYLLTGAAVSGLLGVAAILFIRHQTKLKEDTALSIVLSVFFGIGVAMLSVAQNMPAGNAAGLESFIYGKTASMIASDAWLIGVAAFVCVLVCLLLFKELTLLCFDDGFAGSRGMPVLGLDAVLMGLVVTVTIVGLQAVGLVLMIALLVIPPSAARFWTESVLPLAVLSALIGAVSCILGAALSALIPKLPSGAMIVLVSGIVFFISMIVGTQRGVLIRAIRRLRLNGRIDRQHVLRGLYELSESRTESSARSESDTTAIVEPVVFEPLPVPYGQLLDERSWSVRRLNAALRRCEDEGLLRQISDGTVQLSSAGTREAARLTREHRLWEMYLITHAEIAPSRVDRDADDIEHVLGPEIIAELEAILAREAESEVVVPLSPHMIIPQQGAIEIPIPGKRRRSARLPKRLTKDRKPEDRTSANRTHEQKTSDPTKGEDQ
jgi:manganese/zinc/iron transport system permease protein